MKIPGGYILLARKILENASWNALNEAGKIVMLTLLTLANHKDRKWYNPLTKQEILIKRGQCIIGRKSLAEKSRVGQRSVRTALYLLKTTNFLTIQATSRFSIVSITNYEFYQNPKNYTDQVSDQQTDQPPTSHRPAADQPPTTLNELKNGNNEKNEKRTVKQPLFSFEEIYFKYPKRVGRKEAGQHFKANVKTEQDWQDIQTALKNYLASKRVAKGFIQNASTWFNNWRDWINFKEEEVNSDVPESIRNFIKLERTKFWC